MRFANGSLTTDLPPTPLRQIGIIFMFRWPVRGLVAQSFSGKLKGLEEAIGMTIVDPIRDEEGWAFRDPSGKIPPGAPFESTDPINGFQFLTRSLQGNRSRLQRARHCAGALGQTNKEDCEQLRGRHLPHVQRSVQ